MQGEILVAVATVGGEVGAKKRVLSIMVHLGAVWPKLMYSVSGPIILFKGQDYLMDAVLYLFITRVTV